MTRARRFIIEHPTRGILVDTELTESGAQRGRFSPTKSRVQGMMFTTLLSASNTRSLIRPFALQGACQIRQEPTDEEIQRGPYQGDAWKIVG